MRSPRASPRAAGFRLEVGSRYSRAISDAWKSGARQGREDPDCSFRLKSCRKSLPTFTEGCYAAGVKTLVCPHCVSQVSADAHVCARCGAEIVRGATRLERRLVGVLFAIGAFVVGAWFLQIWGSIQSSSLLPRPDSDAAIFVFLGIIGLLIAGYILGSSVARLFRRSQVRFFRSYRYK
jgi:hypothetical protein